MSYQIPDVVGQTADAFDRGYKQTNGFFDFAAQRKAGQNFAAGDYKGAANVLAQRPGMMGDAMKVQQYGQGLADDQVQRTNDAQDRTMKMNSDRATAEKAVQVQRAQQVVQFATALESLPPEKMGEAFDNIIAPAMLQQGYPQELLDQFRAKGITPENVRALRLAMGGQIDKLQAMSINGGGIAFANETRGTVDVVRKPDPKLVTFANGASVYDPASNSVVASSKKTFAPRAAGKGGAAASAGGGNLSGMSTADLLAALRGSN